MSDERVFSERDLPFRKLRKQEGRHARSNDSLGRRAIKAVAGAALTGDPSGALAGAVADTVIDKLWRRW